MAKNDPEIAKLLRDVARKVTETIAVRKVTIAKEMEFTLKRRVFNDGLNADGQLIGKYSTRPFRFTAEMAKKLGSQVRGAKPAFYPGGYAEFRRSVGRQAAYVDLELTGNLRNSITSGTTETGATVGYLNQEASDLGDKLDGKYGDVFALSPIEIERAEQLAEDLATEILEGIFND